MVSQMYKKVAKYQKRKCVAVVFCRRFGRLTTVRSTRIACVVAALSLTHNELALRKQVRTRTSAQQRRFY